MVNFMLPVFYCNKTLPPLLLKWPKWIKNKTKQNKLQQYAAYKRDILALKIHMDWKWRDGKRHFQKMVTKKKARVVILDETELELKMVERNKEGHYIMIKGSIHQNDIKFMNIYVPNIRVPKYIKHKLKELKWGINSNTVIVGDFNNNPLSSMDGSFQTEN